MSAEPEVFESVTDAEKVQEILCLAAEILCRCDQDEVYCEINEGSNTCIFTLGAEAIENRGRLFGRHHETEKLLRAIVEKLGNAQRKRYVLEIAE